MRQFTQIVDQIEEAKNLIAQGSVSQLRMALLLLDNAVELLADRTIAPELALGKHLRKEAERLRKQAQRLPPSKEYLKMVEEGAIDRSTEKKLRRYFEEKLKFVESRRDKEWGTIDSSTRRALSAIHRYRNEAYHSNRVRRETIRPVVMLLFEIACNLLVTLRGGGHSISSQDDWSEFEQRFGVRAFDAAMEPGIQKIGEILRSGVALTPSELAESLADHLETRFAEFEELLREYGAGSSLEEKFSEAKKWIVAGSEVYEEANDEFKHSVREFSLATFSTLKSSAEIMRHLNEKVALFAAYADLEDAFEPIEQCLFDLVYEIDEMINQQVHEARERELFER